jgi:enamine deaminase RidA (YjgF/YER057c/UK114 family)
MKNNEEKFMTIVRIDAEARWSDVVIHNQTLYYTGVPENLDADAFEQTANTLAQIDAILQKQGSDKSKILDATIFLANKEDFAAMNKAWDAWVVAGHAPACRDQKRPPSGRTTGSAHRRSPGFRRTLC